MSLPKYPAYKDSGVEWLGDVPEHWCVKRLRFVVKLNPSKGEIAHLSKDTLVSFLAMDAIGDDGTISLGVEKEIAEVETGYTYFCDGDVTVAKITPCFENGKGAVMEGLTNGIGFGTTELVVARPIADQIGPIYLQAIFTSTEFRKNGEGAMYGAGGQKRISDDFVRNFKMAFPPLEEQTIIANFLDQETSKIDALVAEQESLIALLKEKRQAVISHAVTKGLNPNAPMKDSGIEWLGEVPAHWEIKRLKFLGEAIIGLTYDPSNVVDEADGLLVLRSSNVQKGRITFDDNVYVNSAIPKKLITRIGDILICSRNGSRALVGKNAVVGKESEGLSFGAFMTVFRSKHNAYLAHVFNSSLFEFQSGSFLTSTVNQLTTGNLYSFEVPVPSTVEQNKIAHFLKVETEKFDLLVSEAHNAVMLLKERRSALISAAVTGKIDVRDIYLNTQASRSPAMEPA